MPLSGLFQRGGRLYKTQSCGSIVRDKINHNTKINANTLTSSRNKHSINMRNSGLLTATFDTRLIGGSHEELDHCQNSSYLLLAETPLKKIQKYIDDDDPDPEEDNEPDIEPDSNSDNYSTSKQQVSKYSDVSLCSKC